MMNKNRIKYIIFTIFQASQVNTEKKTIESENDASKMALIHAVAIYTSTNFPLLKESILYLKRHLQKNRHHTLKLCTQLIAFDMSSNLLMCAISNVSTIGMYAM